MSPFEEIGIRPEVSTSLGADQPVAEPPRLKKGRTIMSQEVYVGVDLAKDFHQVMAVGPDHQVLAPTFRIGRAVAE